MKKRTEVFETKLSSQAIDECSDKVKKFINELGLSNSDAIRYSLSVEEILLKYCEFEDERNIRLTMGTRFLIPFISLEVDGKSFNAYFDEKENQSIISYNLLGNIGVIPEYSYSNFVNCYSFRLKEKHFNIVYALLISVFLAVLIGVIGLYMPNDLRNKAVNYAIVPLNNVFLDIFDCIAGPMVFLSVAWGIYGIGDVATLKQVGKKLLFGYIGAVFAIVIVLGWMCIPIFSLTFSSSNGGISEISAVFKILLGIFPKNFVSPFVEGNTLQIIFLAVVIGIAMIFLGKKTSSVAKAVEQINYIVQFLIEFISKLVPFFIFVVLIKMIWSDTAAVLFKVGKLFIIFILTVALMVVAVLLFCSLKNQVSPFLLAKKGLPTLLIAITTASSAASFGTNMEACKSEYGINDKLASFGIPLGMVCFKPTTAISYVVMTLFFAELYNIEISFMWIFLMMFTSAILALATPPIPGGALTAYTMLFAQLNIPTEALAIALACDTIFDFIETGSDQFLLPFALLNQSGKLGMTDREKLLKKKV